MPYNANRHSSIVHQLQSTHCNTLMLSKSMRDLAVWSSGNQHA
jgi:hypothetical protein